MDSGSGSFSLLDAAFFEDARLLLAILRSVAMTERTDFSGEITGLSEKNKFLARVYGWMALALVISGVTAYYTVTNHALLRILFAGRGYLVLFIAEIALVWMLSASIRRISAATAMAAFLAYSVLNGLTLSSIFLVYRLGTIYRVFFISAALFAAMTVYGMRTRSDIRSAGRYLIMGAIGVFIASLVNIFLRSSTFDWLISVATVIVFTGLTAYDSNKMLAVANRADGTEVFKKASIIGALELYLDFINIFLSLLRLFGRRRG